ncbi:hypothetical protein AALP_AA1G070400 [Arabis alpina]|uniref:Uncharacterized protein n=1 Tax=Arabis alpina TaxID=50452 RepID=A0A087HLN4_ARAAL|nr:hypothetical protein AALP_AA1G070400 [Arabis alpina]
MKKEEVEVEIEDDTVLKISGERHVENGVLTVTVPKVETKKKTQVNFPQLKTFDFSSNGINHLFDPIRGYKSFQRLKMLRTLDLSSNDLNNSVLPFISAARSLVDLNLGGIELKGVFPPNELANMTELKVLKLDGNKFNSFSVQGLINLRELEVLDLRANLITDVEACDDLRTTKLKTLDLSYNKFSEAAGLKGLENLVELKVLSLAGNNFNHTRSIEVLKDMSKLQELDLHYNEFTNLAGVVFPSSLQVLNLKDNQLSLTLKGYSNICALTNLRELDLSRNALTNLPYCLGNLTRLRTLALSENELNGNLSSFVSGLPSAIEYLSFLGNNFNGSFLFKSLLKRLQLQNVILGSKTPGFLIHQHDLRYVYLSHNKLKGAFPTWLVQNNTRLQTLLLNSNSLSTLQLPKLVHGLQFLDISGEMKSLLALDVSSNGLSGQLPKTFLSLLNSKDLSAFDISENSISGAIPHWIGRMSGLSNLYMRGNELKGPFPHQLQSLSSLEVIDISHNSFSGSIPRNLDFPFLKELRLQSNEFMGTIPDTLFKADVLEVLDLRNNNFFGMILNAIGNSSRLRILLLGNNIIQSHIPEKICKLSQVGLLDLSHNKFKGVIPSCLGNMSFGSERYEPLFGPSSYHGSNPLLLHYWRYTSAFYLEDDYSPTDGSQQPPATTVDFLTKNRDEAYQRDSLQYMYGLDLSSNQLSGEIPVEIGNLKSIRSLNFSSNYLTGSIPKSISKLKDLESLDLSNNKLDGNIPPQLADLNSLGYFDVSCNNLSGEIPLKGHLITFDEKSYIGNDHLCGRPSNNSCYLTVVPEPSASKQAKEEEEEEGDGVLDMVWFYWTCGAVYISTSLALFAFLCIDSRWSRGWFYRVDLLVHYLQRFKGCFVSG